MRKLEEAGPYDLQSCHPTLRLELVLEEQGQLRNSFSSFYSF